MNTTKIKVTVPGKGAVTLQPHHHLATGGEGSVYLHNNVVYKLFLEPEKAAASGMAEKIGLLSQINHPFIVAPTNVLHDDQHRLVGYTMPEVKGVSLMQTFANQWRTQNNFGIPESMQLVENMRLAIEAAHDHKALVVDGNEMNYLADGVEPRLIDVDSWQIGKFKATALMPSIKDYQAAQFDEKSDWFAWSIVSFQVFTGIHPYKGTHPDFKRGDMAGRMQANVSVFDPKTSLNSAVRDFNDIPSGLRDWYERVFSGERSAPPSVNAPTLHKGFTRKHRTVNMGASHQQVKHDRVHLFGGMVQSVSSNGFTVFSENGAGRVFDLVRNCILSGLDADDVAKITTQQSALVRYEGGVLKVSLEGDALRGRFVQTGLDPTPGNTLTPDLPVVAQNLILFGNRLFAMDRTADRGMMEIGVNVIGQRPVLSVRNVWPVQIQSTRFFDGVGVWDALGMPFLVVPDKDAVTITRCRDLKNFRVVAAYARGAEYVAVNALSIMDGLNHRMDFILEGQDYKKISDTVCDNGDLNVAINSKGIAVEMVDDGALTVQNTQSAGTVKRVNDAALKMNMRLFAQPDGIFYFVDDSVWKMGLS